MRPALQRFLKIQPAGPRHLEVQDDASRTGFRRLQQEVPRGCVSPDLVTFRLEQAGDGDPDAAIVVDDMNNRSVHDEPLGSVAVGSVLRADAASCDAIGPGAGSPSRYAGSMIRNSAPSARFSAESFPPWSSTMEREIDSPSPIPSGLVEKKESKRRGSWSGGMPQPLSLTAISTLRSAPDLVRTLRRRFSGAMLAMASNALTHRLTRACWSCTRSARTGGSSGASAASTAAP